MKTSKKAKPTTEVAAYKLPVDLVRVVRMEAAVRGVWPARVVAERLRESYQAKPAVQSA